MEKNWKFYLGIALLIFSAVPLCTVELLLWLPLSKTQALMVGAVYLASGEGAFLLAATLLGKPFLAAVKQKILGFFNRSKQTPPRRISKTRHYVGVSLFLLSFVPYPVTELALLFCNLQAAHLQALLILLLSGELLGIVSLFVLGEEFWARLQRLFQWPGNDAS